MSIEISGNYGQAGYVQQAKQAQRKEAAEHNEKALDQKAIPQDEYIPGENSASKPIGLYHLEKDENGNPQKSTKKCTTNTDKVDREIEKLKERKEQLEYQIQAASGNDRKVRELEKKLAQVERALNQKDNDTYRRQNAKIS